MNPDTRRLDLSVIVPVFNDAEALADFAPRLMEQLACFPGDHRIIVVDDGSNDNLRDTFNDLQKLPAPNIRLTLVQLSRNFGKEAAMVAGLDLVDTDAVVFMDGDGQHPVALLERMRELLLGGTDIAATVQIRRNGESFVRRAFKRLYYHFLEDNAQIHMPPNAGDFRMLNRAAYTALRELPERQRMMKGLFSWIGFETVYLPFDALPRLHGETKFNFAKLSELAMSGVTSFSTRPITWISRIGALISLISIAYAIYVVIDYWLHGPDTPGWATVVAGLMFLCGLQLMSLGLLGEYIGNIFNEVKRRPIFIVKRIEGDQ